MWLRAKCGLYFQMRDSTPLILMLRPRSVTRQWVARESYTLSHEVLVREFTDIFGNLCQRLVAPAGEFSINTSADVMIADEPDEISWTYFVDIPELPDPVLMYLLPSRFCESDRFGQMTTDIVAGAQPGHEQVAGIDSWINKSIRYLPGSSLYPESAVEVNMKGYGVCRDLAHLGIAMCRSISIPARLVVGYLYNLEPMDLHAWFEAYVGGRWYTFDPIQTDSTGSRIAIAYGRDAADVAVYNQFGPPAVYTNIDVSVELLESKPAGA